MAELNDTISYMLTAIAIASLIGAFILRLATKWVTQVEVPYFRAYFTLVIAGVIGFVIQLPMEFAALSLGADELALGMLELALAPIQFLIQALVIRWRLELTFSESLLVCLVMIGIVIGLVVVIVGVLVAILFITQQPFPAINY